ERRKISRERGTAWAMSKPIPASIDPWPGKQNAILLTRLVHLLRPANDRRTPCQACSHPCHQHELSRSEPSVLRRVGEGERDRAGGSIAVSVNVDHNLLRRNAELLGCVVDD